ncbi:hypothetical protein GCM10009765_36230 [Fodinicola feengrottensis]|uniref:Uncharacterized protein n=2 Tax=Fodinicola feengrottensis TaxID=435914 RepID=A0ABN2H8M9_9ACTN
MAGALAATVTPAAAAPANGGPWECDGVTNCQRIANLNGGNIFVDIDAWGGGDEKLAWQMEGVGNCDNVTTINAPAQTWECWGVPGGAYTLKAYGNGGIHSFRMAWRQAP